MQALVAEHSGQLLGLAHMLFHRTTISIKSVCCLQDLFTVEAARGKGVGRADRRSLSIREACRLQQGVLAHP
jgi:GNAT superfamily N-acetyltransferase